MWVISPTIDLVVVILIRHQRHLVVKPPYDMMLPSFLFLTI
jgi:hypothetical protein